MRCFKRPKHDWKWNLVNTVWPIRLVSCSLQQLRWFCMHARYVRCQKVFPGLKNWIAVPFRSYANFRGHTEVFTMCKGKGIQHMSRFSQLVCVLCFQAKQAEEVKGANPWRSEWKDGAECGMDEIREETNEVPPLKSHFLPFQSVSLLFTTHMHSHLTRGESISLNLQWSRWTVSVVTVVYPPETPCMCA